MKTTNFTCDPVIADTRIGRATWCEQCGADGAGYIGVIRSEGRFIPNEAGAS